MLKRRLIPKLQLVLRRSYRGVQPVLAVTRQFGDRRAIGNPVSQAKIYEAQLADELILIDIERTEESWSMLLETLECIADELATPLTVGGGVKNFEQVQALLDRGADKVVLNSAALKQPSLVDRVAGAYGSQCLVLGMVSTRHSQKLESLVECGKLDENRRAVEWAKEAVDRGAGEIMATAIERDGTGKGLDVDLTAALAETLSVPVIAAGGCGLSQHFVEGYQAGASAVAAGTFFSQRDQNPMQCRSHIRNAGLPIRLEV